MTLTRSDRIRGSLAGLATCDALGGPVEFRKRGTFPLVTDLQPNANFSLPAGCFTDDTSMALCLAHSLLAHHGQHDTVDQVRRYLRWRDQGYMSSVGYCFDVGAATNSVLTKWRAALPPRLLRDNTSAGDHSTTSTAASQDATSMSVEEKVVQQIEAEIVRDFGAERYCGNGSLMRVVPVALVARSESEARVLARRSSLITHPHPRCVQGCEVYVSLVVRALQGHSKEELAGACAGFLGVSSQADLASAVNANGGGGGEQTQGEAAGENFPKAAVAVGGGLVRDEFLYRRLAPYTTLAAWRSKSTAEIKSSGYVVDSVEASLWAFFSTDSFEAGAVRVVNLGDDADTVGAIYGGLAGAFYGFDAIPTRWMEGMRKMEMVDEVVNAVLALREM